MKEIEILLTQPRFKATAMLLEDENPRLCEAFWRFLEKPLEQDASHGSYSGAALIVFPLKTPQTLKEENATIHVGRGGIVLNCHPFPQPHQYATPRLSGKMDELLIFYGRGQPRYLDGPKPASVVARICNEDLVPFSEACSNFYIKKRLGKQRIIVRRKEK